MLHTKMNTFNVLKNVAGSLLAGWLAGAQKILLVAFQSLTFIYKLSINPSSVSAVSDE